MSAAGVEVDPLVPGRDVSLLRRHGRHRLCVARVPAGVSLAGEGRGLWLGQLAHVVGLRGGERRQLLQAELVTGRLVVAVLDTKVGDDSHAPPGGVPATVVVVTATDKCQTEITTSGCDRNRNIPIRTGQEDGL